MKCKCAKPAVHSLRLKIAAGQWQYLAACCNDCLESAVTEAKSAGVDMNTLQRIPFNARDWPTLN